MHIAILAFMLDGGPYVPDLVWRGCYIAPPVAIAVSWFLARRNQHFAALGAALTGSCIAAQRVRFAIGHMLYYQDTREWLVVGFAAAFPLYCGLRYVSAPKAEPAAPDQRP